jgi:hypothetical protein
MIHGYTKTERYGYNIAMIWDILWTIKIHGWMAGDSFAFSWATVARWYENCFFNVSTEVTYDSLFFSSTKNLWVHDEKI